ncbi:MAG: hypothetical protein AAF317_00520 [Pseudomonadota bacterium]
MAARFKLMQKQILALLKRRSRPASAYELRDELRREYPKSAPVSAYRVRATLIASGKAHRIGSINASTAGRSHAFESASIPSVCDECDLVAAAASDELVADLTRLTEKTGVMPRRHVAESHGRCVSCCGEGALK